MLGLDLMAARCGAASEVVGLTRGDLDITERRPSMRRCGDHRPDVVVNCAAWTAVDDAEAQ